MPSATIRAGAVPGDADVADSGGDLPVDGVEEAVEAPALAGHVVFQGAQLLDPGLDLAGLEDGEVHRGCRRRQTFEPATQLQLVGRREAFDDARVGLRRSGAVGAEDPGRAAIRSSSDPPTAPVDLGPEDLDPGLGEPRMYERSVSTSEHSPRMARSSASVRCSRPSA